MLMVVVTLEATPEMEKINDDDELCSSSSCPWCNNIVFKNDDNHKLCLWSSSPWRQHTQDDKKDIVVIPLVLQHSSKKMRLKMSFAHLQGPRLCMPSRSSPVHTPESPFSRLLKLWKLKAM
jgi:hypothetical protein